MAERARRDEAVRVVSEKTAPWVVSYAPRRNPLGCGDVMVWRRQAPATIASTASSRCGKSRGPLHLRPSAKAAQARGKKERKGPRNRGKGASRRGSRHGEANELKRFAGRPQAPSFVLGTPCRCLWALELVAIARKPIGRPGRGAGGWGARLAS
eukprot:GSA120T00012546001.1